MTMNRWFLGTLIVCAFSFVTLAATADEDTQHKHGSATGTPNEVQINKAIAKLAKGDQAAAAAQRYCPLMATVRLGAMGTPVKVMIDGKPVFVCCRGCTDEAIEHGKETLATVQKLKKATDAIAKLPAADQPLADAQLFCPIAKGSRLGGMGTPVKVMLDGQPVFVCCQGCVAKARQNSKATLAKVEEIKKANADVAHHDGDGHAHDEK